MQNTDIVADQTATDIAAKIVVGTIVGAFIGYASYTVVEKISNYIDDRKNKLDH